MPPAVTKALVTDALAAVLDPLTGRALTLRHVAACDGHATVKVDAEPGSTPPAMDQAAKAAHRAIVGAAGDALVGLHVEFTDPRGTVVHAVRFGAAARSRPSTPAQPAAPAAGAGHRPIPGLGPERSAAGGGGGGGLPGVRRVIAVGAGKGGVGKSTIAVNLAVGLARRGHAVGLLDGDIYGPSIPTMLGLDAMEQVVHAGKLQPFYVHGVKAVTIGKLVDADKPLIWRGPMAHGAFKQLAEQTDWGDLDYLVIDLPPGTGDVPLTMAQALSLTGAVIVCTPQKVAQDDAVRAAQMFRQLGIEVLGVVENMSTFIADDLDPPREYDLFGKGGAAKMASRLGVPFLGAVPVTIALRENSDRGDPSANFAQKRDRKGPSLLAEALETLVTNVEQQAALAAVRQGKAKPTLTIR
ncbi:MAG: Mrp/NBP35 family ATP-binding protein [Phycisphaerales bacterium]